MAVPVTVMLQAGQWRLRAAEDWPEFLHIEAWVGGVPYLLAEAPRAELERLRGDTPRSLRAWPTVFCRVAASKQVKVPKLMFFPTPAQPVILRIQDRSGAIERLKPPFPEVVGKAQMGCRL